jgi:hypothetical protein
MRTLIKYLLVAAFFLFITELTKAQEREFSDMKLHVTNYSNKFLPSSAEIVNNPTPINLQQVNGNTQQAQNNQQAVDENNNNTELQPAFINFEYPFNNYGDLSVKYFIVDSFSKKDTPETIRQKRGRDNTEIF